MSPSDFVYNQIYKGLLNKGCPDRIAHQHAVKALEDFKKGKMGKRVSHLIEQAMKSAMKEAKAQLGVARLKKAENEARLKA